MLFISLIISVGLQIQAQEISTKFMSGNVIFTWPSSGNYSFYDVTIAKDTTIDPTDRITIPQYIVKHAILYDSIRILMFYVTPDAREIRSTCNVVKIETKIGDTVNISWTAEFFPLSGQYKVYQNYRQNITIFSITSSGVSYGRDTVSTKYAYLTRPFISTNIMFEIRDITLDDAGYYNGGTSPEAAWSDGGVVLIIHSRPSKPNITGDLNVEVNRYITLTCSSQSTSAPDYYSKLVTLSYTWFVNDTKMDRETRDTLSLYVTREHKYHRYSCTATEEGLESDRSDPVKINPLYGPDRIIIIPEPILNSNDKLTVREGETIGPFVCTADCNPSCSMTWKVKDSSGFSDAHSDAERLLQQAVQRNMLLFQCKANRGDRILSKRFQLDVQYLNETLLYINDEMKSNVELTENTPLRISCHMDGNPAPAIRLSRGQGDTELLAGQGTWLNYTINTAQCTDTDTYTCSGTSTGFNREKVFNINVLCKTRFDTASIFKYIYGSKSGMDALVNVTVPIIANPPPLTSDFTWDGPIRVSVRTTISRGDATYKHVIRSFLPAKDQNYFGNYTLEYKGETISTITINVEDIPQTPLNFKGYSFTNRYINLTWISGFNGGCNQFFIVYLKEGSMWRELGNLTDPGEGREVKFDHGPLTPGREYWLRLQSCNKINCSSTPADVRAVVKDTFLKISNLETKDDETSRPHFVAISLLSFILGLTWLIVALFVIYKRRYHSGHQNSKHGEESIQREAQNMTHHYDDVQGTVVERIYTDANGDNTEVEGTYTELGRADQETPYEVLKA